MLDRDPLLSSRPIALETLSLLDIRHHQRDGVAEAVNTGTLPKIAS